MQGGSNYAPRGWPFAVPFLAKLPESDARAFDSVWMSVLLQAAQERSAGSGITSTPDSIHASSTRNNRAATADTAALGLLRPEAFFLTSAEDFEHVLRRVHVPLAVLDAPANSPAHARLQGWLRSVMHSGVTVTGGTQTVGQLSHSQCTVVLQRLRSALLLHAQGCVIPDTVMKAAMNVASVAPAGPAEDGRAGGSSPAVGGLSQRLSMLGVSTKPRQTHQFHRRTVRRRSIPAAQDAPPRRNIHPLLELEDDPVSWWGPADMLEGTVLGLEHYTDHVSALDKAADVDVAALEAFVAAGGNPDGTGTVRRSDLAELFYDTALDTELVDAVAPGANSRGAPAPLQDEEEASRRAVETLAGAIAPPAQENVTLSEGDATVNRSFATGGALGETSRALPAVTNDLTLEDVRGLLLDPTTEEEATAESGTEVEGNTAQRGAALDRLRVHVRGAQALGAFGGAPKPTVMGQRGDHSDNRSGDRPSIYRVTKHGRFVLLPWVRRAPTKSQSFASNHRRGDRAEADDGTTRIGAGTTPNHNIDGNSPPPQSRRQARLAAAVGGQSSWGISVRRRHAPTTRTATTPQPRTAPANGPPRAIVRRANVVRPRSREEDGRDGSESSSSSGDSEEEPAVEAVREFVPNIEAEGAGLSPVLAPTHSSTLPSRLRSRLPRSERDFTTVTERTSRFSTTAVLARTLDVNRSAAHRRHLEAEAAALAEQERAEAARRRRRAAAGYTTLVEDEDDAVGPLRPQRRGPPKNFLQRSKQVHAADTLDLARRLLAATSTSPFRPSTTQERTQHSTLPPVVSPARRS